MLSLKDWLIEAIDQYKEEQNYKVKMAQITIGLIDDSGCIHYIESKYTAHDKTAVKPSEKEFKMKKKLKKRWYKTPCSWEMYGYLEVEAKTIDEAMRKAKKEAIDCYLPDGEYIDESFKLDLDKELIKNINQ